MFCGTLGFRGNHVEEYWARLYFSTHTEIHFDEHKSNYTFIRFTQKCFLRPNKAHVLAGKKLKSTYKSLELTTGTRLPTVIHHYSFLSYMTSYKDYDQTSTTTQHSINQPCSESVKFDIKWVDKRVVASCKKPIDTTSLIHDCLLFG